MERELCISSITAMELYFGARDKAEVKKLERFIALFTVIYPDETLSRKATELIKKYAKSHSLDIPDSIIAATALNQRCKLFTYNRKDFRYIDGVELV
jgi:predicted nucleic acid-binding protein